jgi:hypothetical protein
LLEFLEDIGISMSAGYLSNLLIKNHADFETEKTEVYSAGLESSPWQHFDQTAARVGGVNHTTNVICFFEYIRDRISQVGNIPSLASIIREKSALNSFGLSWMPE